MNVLLVFSMQLTAVKSKNGELKFLSGPEDSEEELEPMKGWVYFRMSKKQYQISYRVTQCWN